ncbi:Mannosyl-glycoprotein endo-beta-N-acetylglucosaminidase [Paenibacillus sp. UNCCL117]|uniref:glycoside hydrolase family 73 protein n=1 Tax=unclassified Paenibacillus TaxID=185978 RepID=UPI00088AA226|nr:MULTISPECIES: glucosaminidase domain-containing protein [unclassified Paenibacillus]SDD75872.1 Mannosyl-glycoprotein endo-beta-N-acetylglucosaminidase [Paenibacillus sp. cl123]SFW52289.1 Mannosyl-glycoprotein endo-beta-N-acetylglucosaminidase [Paenibacillus sp. UNCCL117]
MSLTPQAFIATLAPIAVKLRAEGSPIFPSVRIAQAMLETGCTLHSWNNLVGLKAGSGRPNAYWSGRTVSTKTWEVYDGVRYDGIAANWRAYDTITDGFRDQDLLFQAPRYARVRQAASPHEQTAMLLVCGYATDPRYADKLNSLIANHLLTAYDRISSALGGTDAMIPLEPDKEEDEMSQPMKLEPWQWELLYEVLGKAYNEDRLDWSWLQKIKDRTMTATELVFVNTVLDGRLDRKLDV